MTEPSRPKVAKAAGQTEAVLSALTQPAGG
jgi:hypothetical protein